MADTRIYEVANGSGAVRLVRAENKAHALRHVVHDYKVQLAGQDALILAIQAGIPVEEAAKDIPDGPA